MFRRKADEAFDTLLDTDPPQRSLSDFGGESVNVLPAGSFPVSQISNPAATAYQPVIPAAHSTPSSGSQAAAPTPAYQSPARPAAEPVRASQPSSFRNLNPASEPTRTRMPQPHDSKLSHPSPSPSTTSTNAHSADKVKPNRRILTVGHDILMKGEIATCDRLVIEGKVDATLNDVHTVEIAESGSFRGNAQIEDAEISGIFEGELVVRNRLVIYATGKVRGKITYGEVEIERGGELTGEIKTISTAENQTRLALDIREKAAA